MELDPMFSRQPSARMACEWRAMVPALQIVVWREHLAMEIGWIPHLEKTGPRTVNMPGDRFLRYLGLRKRVRDAVWQMNHHNLAIECRVEIVERAMKALKLAQLTPDRRAAAQRALDLEFHL
jgi:hypothetical protein